MEKTPFTTTVFTNQPLQQRAPLNPPVPKLTSTDNEETYDAFLNACLHPNDPVRAMNKVLKQFKKVGVTKKQLDMFIKRAEANDIPIPNMNHQKELEKIIIEADPKFAKIGNDAVLQNVADKFGLFIYNKKFNDGINGAFGEAQNIQPSAKGKFIILKIPSYVTTRRFTSDTFNKILNSMKHYEQRGNGTVTIKYYNPS